MKPSVIVMIRLKNYAQARFYYRKASHLNQEDSKLYYKIACTYMNEEQYGTRHKTTGNGNADSSGCNLNITWQWVNAKCS